jgi:putative FmdB family regulatory protein
VPTYAYRCSNPDCAQEFATRRPVEKRDSCACPTCAFEANRVFNPRQVMIQTPAHLKETRSFYQPQSTPQHTSDYLEGKVLADYCDGMQAKQEEARKNHVSFEQFFAKRHPGVDLNQRLTPQETAEVKQALGVTNA